jgi:O-antigen/teichoic acid export membrane protein
MRPPITATLPVSTRRLRIPASARGGFLYLTGEALSKGITFVVLIALTRFVSQESFAYVNLYISYANICALVIGLGLQNAIVRFYFKDGVRFSSVLGSAVSTIIVVGGAVLAIGFLLRGQIAPALAVPPVLIPLAALGGIVIALRTCFIASLRACRRAGMYALAEIAEATIGTSLIVVVVVLHVAGYVSVVSSLATATGIVVVFAFLDWTRGPSLTLDRTIFRPILVFSVPLILHGLALYLLQSYGQIAVNVQLGPIQAATYAYSARFALAMVVVSTAFSSVWMPAFFETVRTPEGRQRLGVQAFGYAMFMVSAGVCLMIVLPIVASLLAGPAYASAVRLIPILIYSYLWFVLYTLVLGYHMHDQRTAAIATVTVISMLAGLALVHILIVLMGVTGAAVASVAGYAALFLGQWGLLGFARRDAGWDIPYLKLCLLMVAIGVVPVALWYVLPG